ncbi:MAG: hypothetical protein MJ170_00215 [Alphaproteobacteria bacterium]|nr:hypothetical protein [Alphaproteobacteria bacterium]
MKKIVYLLIGCLVALPAFGAEYRGRAVQNAARQMTGSVRMQGTSIMSASSAVPMNPSVTGINPITQAESVMPVPKDMREKERTACLNNNIGVGNTFVWASKYSDTSNYATMVEDTDNPENNVCFVKVDLKSDDSRISVSDVPSKYFEWGKTITCGSWANADTMRARILDAKKSARVWGTIGGAVGGAGIGVGAMELFGNRLLAKNEKLSGLEGQKNLDGVDLLYSQVKALGIKSNEEYQTIINKLQQLKKGCDSMTGEKPAPCTSDYYKLAEKFATAE